MIMIFGIPGPLLFGQLLLGLINGAFYAMLSLGLAVIFGMLNIINFAHGSLFMMGAFASWMLLNYVGIGYFPALILAPILVGIFGIILEKTIISRLYKLDHLYGLLLTFGLSLVIEGLFRNAYGSSGMPYRIPDVLQGATNLGFMYMPNYRGWVVLAALIVCISTWAIIEKTSLGATLRAATENAPLVQAFGVDVPRLITLTYGGGVALAGEPNFERSSLGADGVYRIGAAPPAGAQILSGGKLCSPFGPSGKASTFVTAASGRSS